MRCQRPRPVCRACRGAGWNGAALDPVYCAILHNGGLFELQESRPAIRAGVQMCGQDYPLDAAGPYITL
jgi:hypothetical protein